MIQTIISYDPSNGDTLGELQAATPEQIEQVVQRSRAASLKWKQVSLEDRLKAIRIAYGAAESSVHDLAELFSREMGKDIQRAGGESNGTVHGGPMYYLSKGLAEKGLGWLGKIFAVFFLVQLSGLFFGYEGRTSCKKLLVNGNL